MSSNAYGNCDRAVLPLTWNETNRIFTALFGTNNQTPMIITNNMYLNYSYIAESYCLQWNVKSQHAMSKEQMNVDVEDIL